MCWLTGCGLWRKEVKDDNMVWGLSNGKSRVAIDLQEDSKEVNFCHFKFEMLIVYWDRDDEAWASEGMTDQIRNIFRSHQYINT